MKSQLKNIVFLESFLLGWKVDDQTLVLYLELFLTKKHLQFEKYDPKVSIGCYKLGILTCNNPTQLSGMATISKKPKWNPSLQEYFDESEIDKFDVEENSAFVELDSESFHFKFETLKLEVLDQKRFD